jgi:tetratricopeptide (TPR) repeat protein
MKRRAAALPALFLVLSFAVIPARPAEPPPVSDEAVFNRLADEGLAALYNLDYDGAEAKFREMETRFPDNPLSLYAVSTELWWELTNEFDEKNPSMERDFLAAADRAAAAARAYIKRTGDPDGRGHLCLGGALGLKARWEAIQGQWLSAYSNGKKAFKLQEKAIAINPNMYDAYLGVGIFHYYAATLSSVVKVLAHFIFGGNKQQGLDEIRLSMEKGRFSRTAAQLFMVGILINNEKDPPAALALLQEGRREFPRSPFFQLLEMLILDEAKDWDGLDREARDFLARVDRGQPFYRPEYRHRALWSQGNAALGRGDARRAIEIYDGILAQYPLEDRWLTMTFLNRGRAHDRLGEREKAIADYNEVLKRRNVWQLHDKAKALLKTPDRA